MIIDCISDLHGHLPPLEGGDILIIAGDICRSKHTQEWKRFFEWFKDQKYLYKILVGGNHDNFLAQCVSTEASKELGINEEEGFEYLCDSGCEIEGFNIWGSPWTKWFEGMNPSCQAFTCKEEGDLADKFRKIPFGTDILITHSPPLAILDQCEGGRAMLGHAGSASLRARVDDLKPKLHVFGHIHEAHGMLQVKWDDYPYKETFFVNASLMNREYIPVNKPIRIIL